MLERWLRGCKFDAQLLCFFEQGTLLTLLQSTSRINGDLAIAEEANVKLYMSHMVEALVGPRVPTPSSMWHVQPTSRVLVPSPGGFVLHQPTVLV